MCGLSLGGMTAMSLALRAPERVCALVPACTSAAMDWESWNTRATTVRSRGMGAITEMVMERFFSDSFQQDHPGAVDDIRAKFLSINPTGYAGCCGAIRDLALMEEIAAITAPTLVIAGDHDVATPWQGQSDRIVRRIRDAEVAMMPCGHLASVEMPEAFGLALKSFLAEEIHG